MPRYLSTTFVVINTSRIQPCIYMYSAMTQSPMSYDHDEDRKTVVISQVGISIVAKSCTLSITKYYYTCKLHGDLNIDFQTESNVLRLSLTSSVTSCYKNTQSIA